MGHIRILKIEHKTGSSYSNYVLTVEEDVEHKPPWILRLWRGSYIEKVITVWVGDWTIYHNQGTGHRANADLSEWIGAAVWLHKQKLSNPVKSTEEG